MYIYAQGWPGIDLGASHESCAHSVLRKFETKLEDFLTRPTQKWSVCFKDSELFFLSPTVLAWMMVNQLCCLASGFHALTARI